MYPILLDSLRQNIGACLGNRGVNLRMQALFSDASTAWNWDLLLQSKPRAEHVEAFLRLVKASMGKLEHTMWPDECLCFYLQLLYCAVEGFVFLARLGILLIKQHVCFNHLWLEFRASREMILP